MPHLVLIADVIGSRDLPNRAEVQRRLRNSLAARNQARGPQGLLSPYTLTLGDELQAVLAQARGVFRDILTIAADLQPVALRFALAIGDIETPIDPERAIGMDGSAFHRARAGVDQLKQGRGTCRVDGLDGVLAELVNQGIALAFGRLEGARGSRLPLTAGLLAEEPIAAIAARIGRTEQTLYKSAHAADLYAVAGLLRAVETLLDQQLGAAAADAGVA
jgi:hypothetical protein